MNILKKYSPIVLGMILLLLAGCFESAMAQMTDELADRAEKAGIEQSAIETLRDKVKARGLTDEQVANMIGPAVTLAEDGFPANHVVQKALEGLSKGVPDSRITPFINRMAVATRQAAGIVDPWLDKPDLKQMMGQGKGLQVDKNARNRLVEASSRAMMQNIRSEHIEQFLTEIGNEEVLSKSSAENIIAAVDILPDLPMEESPQLTRRFVVKALKGGFGSGELQKLPGALNMAQKRSQIPASNIIKGLSNRMENGMPASDVLQNLFDGNIGGGPPGNMPKGLEKNKGQGNNQSNQGN